MLYSACSAAALSRASQVVDGPSPRFHALWISRYPQGHGPMAGLVAFMPVGGYTNDLGLARKGDNREGGVHESGLTIIEPAFAR